MQKHMYPQAQAKRTANDESINDESIIELTDIIGQNQLNAPKRHDDAVFETLKAPQAINRAYLAPPYPDLLDTIPPYAQGNTNQLGSPSTLQTGPACADTAIINLEQSEIIHTLTDISSQESLLPLTDEHTATEANCPSDEEATQTSPCLKSAPHDDDLNGQMQRDICTLKSTLAAMQLRLAAQEACIADLEAKLMLLEHGTAHATSPATSPAIRAHHTINANKSPAQKQAPEQELHEKLEKIAATVAARTVREEIQDFLIAMQKG